MTTTSNKLGQETSPYLLQHADNPVNWYAWGQEAFEKAKNEDKPLIISVGYSACHWCHVMEHESFEDEEVAELMNQYFVSVKVDREERPDVDQLYIDAVSLMTGQAGWPLNVIVLPDGRPIFGGTYFPKANWMEILREIYRVYTEKYDEVLDYANKLADGIQSINIVEPPTEEKAVEPSIVDQVFNKMAKGFDTTFGGRTTTPKFPIPDNFLFMMRYYARTGETSAWDQTDLTLTQMARGGIYDQLGGGFARYSTDEKWKVPHFEKMLYDNGQLLTAYSEAYQISHNPVYKQVVQKTVQFLEREMLSPEGGFYSALDADTEGEEGKFYTWTSEELASVLTDSEELALIKNHFGIDEAALWENDTNVLIVDKPIPELAKEQNMEAEPLKDKIDQAKQKLWQARESRTRPGLDDKILTSWNALVLKGLADTYQVLGDPKHLALAERNANFLLNTMVDEESNIVYRSFKEGERKIEGFLDDYALLIQGLIHLYEANFKEQYIEKAFNLAEQAFHRFYDETAGLFQFKDRQHSQLITQKFEIADNVIASPNSVMAKNLYYLSHFYGKPEYGNRAKTMFQTIIDQWQKQPYFFANWGTLATHLIDDFYEVAILGPKALSFKDELQKKYLPHKVLAGSVVKESTLPLLKNRWQDDQTFIYVCQNQSCQQPTNAPKKALDQLNA